MGDPLQEFEEARFGRNTAGVAEHGLADYSRDLACMAREELLNALPVIPNRYKNIVVRPLPESDGYRCPRIFLDLVWCGMNADENAIVPTMIVSFKLQVATSTGRSTRQPQRQLDNFSSAISE